MSWCLQRILYQIIPKQPFYLKEMYPCTTEYAEKSCNGTHFHLEETKPPILYHYYKL